MKKINNAVITIMLLINTICLILTVLGYYNSNILVCLSLYIVVFIPKIIRKFKIIVVDEIELTFLIFVFIAQLLGSIMHFYSMIYWFDSFAHYTSGILSALLGLVLLIYLKKYDNRSIGFNILFMMSITLMVAGLWEIFEFTCVSFLHYDAQKVVETGVFDTMKDIICALLGDILVSICYFYEISQNKKMIVSHFVEKIRS